MSLRHLTTAEIHALELQGCACACWDDVRVEDPFITYAYRDVTFSGDIELYPAEGTFMHGAFTCNAGIYDAAIADCRVGRGVHISKVHDYIAGCDIADGTVIRNVSRIDCPKESCHGAGSVVDVLSETGGREVPIYYGLTAQEAWIIAMCRHDMDLVGNLKSDIKEKTAAFRRDRNIIGPLAVIADTMLISGVDVMAGAEVDGASRLVNGTVGEGAFVGTDVIATDFILARGATADTAARLAHVFVGEGSRIANGFSAHHSLIFSNCILENGEAAALFAGPYTVSMHKSTLLIGGMTSMFNAGSGANQSNHLYKTGPCHHGIFERGVKLASGAYVMWPARIGAFSMVMGRHKSHPDTSALPFSYVVENAGATQVIPAVALGNIGIARDADKWPRRDRRPDRPADIITFRLFNPYIAQSIEEGIALLDSLIASQPDADTLTGSGYTIKRPHAERALTLYRMALRHYMLGTMLQRIADGLTLASDNGIGSGRWADVAGMTVPAALVAGGLPDAQAWDNVYRDLEWEWVASRLAAEPGIDLTHPDANAIATLLDEWQHTDSLFTDMLRRDAEKEFAVNNPAAAAGFGLLDPDTAATDFRNVRGTLDTNPVNNLITARTTRAKSLAAAVALRLNLH